MGCCKDEGGDPLWCERRALGKWHCLEAQEMIEDVNTLWKEEELNGRSYLKRI